jgi:hypothetical protein
MTKIQIELPDQTAAAAGEAGLLTSQALDLLLTEALRRRHTAQSLLSIADDIAAPGIEPMSMEEIDAEVTAHRAERRAWRSGGQPGGIVAALRRSPLVGANLDLTRFHESGRDIEV